MLCFIKIKQGWIKNKIRNYISLKSWQKCWLGRGSYGTTCWCSGYVAKTKLENNLVCLVGLNIKILCVLTIQSLEKLLNFGAGMCKMFTCACMLSHSVVSGSWRPHGLQLPGSSVYGDSPDDNTGVGCQALLQGIFPIQGSNPGLLHGRQILYPLSHQGSPRTLEWVA